MEFAATAEEEAKKINAQTGAGYVTDPNFWAKQGIYTGEELALSILNQTYSDLFNSVNNVRPRQPAFISIKSAQDAIDSLDAQVQMMLDQDRIEDEKQVAYERERKELEQLMPGEFDYEYYPTRSGMGRRMEGMLLPMPSLAEAVSLTKPATPLNNEQLKNLILVEQQKLVESKKSSDNNRHISEKNEDCLSEDSLVMERWRRLAGLLR